MKQRGWDAAGTAHSIPVAEYAIVDNSSGTINIQVKHPTDGKLGNVTVSFVKATGQATNIFIVSSQKTTNLSTLTVTVDGATNNISVATDAGCSMCWTVVGAC
jgi:hypothetical protein